MELFQMEKGEGENRYNGKCRNKTGVGVICVEGRNLKRSGWWNPAQRISYVFWLDIILYSKPTANIKSK